MELPLSHNPVCQHGYGVVDSNVRVLQQGTQSSALDLSSTSYHPRQQRDTARPHPLALPRVGAGALGVSGQHALKLCNRVGCEKPGSLCTIPLIGSMEQWVQTQVVLGYCRSPGL